MRSIKNLFLQFLVIAVSMAVVAGCSGSQNQAENAGGEGEEQTETEDQASSNDQQQGQGNQSMSDMQQQSVDIDVSDEELKKFAQVATKVQAVQQGAQQEMIDSVKSTGLTLDEYNQIASQQRGQQAPGQKASGEDIVVSDEQKRKFEEANQKISDMQEGVQQNVDQAIKDAGMDPERFRKIGQALRSDKELQKRFQQIRQKQGGGPGGGMRRQGGGGR